MRRTGGKVLKNIMAVPFPISLLTTNLIIKMAKETINYSDFEKLDIRVGRVTNAKSPEWSEKLLEFEVDFGAEIGKRTIFAGVKKYYNPEFFKGRLYTFIVNLAEKKMGQGISQGMMLMVDDPEKPFPIEIIDPVTEGSVIL